ncbi:hypothetical protein KP509_34G024700 [Ceratopteris richardii]|uniref:BHLH domain-containing protein n=1 Tax=Ceratopteris richardii TaxID=49495 RepID=A0A8T2QJL1_CERRI|nr:hypothetical protein KP509_34G024700 [Ceratopteris richardii]
MVSTSNTFQLETLKRRPCIADVKKCCNGSTSRSGPRNKMQRENHILAERQRREEMNQKFCLLRTLVNKAPKRDKASIVKDAIDYIMELEARVKLLQKRSLLKRTHEAATLEEEEQQKRKEIPNCPNTNSISDIKSSACMSTQCTPFDMHAFNPTSAFHASVGQRSCNVGNWMYAANRLVKCEDEDVNIDADYENRLSPIISSATAPSMASSAPSSSSVLPKYAKNERCASEEMEGNNDDSQVDVQSLGSQAVIKVVCSRSRGLFLRVLQALEECKVDILQSNVTTVGEQVIHFLTIEMSPGVSASVNCIQNGLRIAASNALVYHTLRTTDSAGT